VGFDGIRRAKVARLDIEVEEEHVFTSAMATAR
jgi:hypothetical protein